MAFVSLHCQTPHYITIEYYLQGDVGLNEASFDGADK